MKNIVLFLLLTNTLSSYAQFLEYKTFQSALIEVDQKNKSCVLLNAHGKADLQVKNSHDFLQRALDKELSEKNSDNDRIVKIRRALQENKELIDNCVVGSQEEMNCIVEFAIHNNKLKIYGKNNKGDLLFEYGEGHNQELYLETSDKNKFISIKIYSHETGRMVAFMDISLGGSFLLFNGDIRRNTHMELICLTVNEDNALENKNLDVQRLLGEKLLNIFEVDEDGDRYMICE